MIDERINDNLQRLNKYLVALISLKEKTLEEFINDDISVAACERYFQLAIESCLNIGNRILSIEQFNKHVAAPESYADIFMGLHRIGVIDDKLSISMVKMAKFRNMLVHIYWEIDHAELYKYLHENLNDFELFVKSIVAYYK